MRPFGRTSGALRAVAALVSLGLTVAMFLLLRATSAPAPAGKAEVQVSVTVFPARPMRARSTPVPAPAKTTLRSAASIRPPQPIPPARPVAEPAIASSLPPAGAAPAGVPPASAPLRLDPRTIGRAIAGSEGRVRQMARQSGTELDSPRASRSELLAATVAEKGVADCLAPNAGGSLLSAPILLLRALSGKCK